MDCHHFTLGECRSCFLLEVPRARQVADKEAHCRALVDCPEWLPPIVGPESGFRNKAKMVVAGSTSSPTLGILSPSGEGVDLRDCGLHTPGIQAALPVLASFVESCALTPYDVTARRGELKHLLVTQSPDGELMVRFVLRSQEPMARIRKHLASLLEELPLLRVVSANLLPEHKAVLEGDREIVLTEHVSLPMRLGEVTLHLRPQSFFQTNTGIAQALYATAHEWVSLIGPSSVWDLYCGVGGFALHLAAPGRTVLGVETSEEAVASATTSARDASIDARFVAGDATAFALAADEPPDLVVVNPPRRGIGPSLSRWLGRSGVEHVLYSSCRAETLARDLSDMPSLRPVRAVVLDMFPHTDHYEVLTLLRRTQ